MKMKRSKQQQLQYLNHLLHLRQAYVLKDDIHLTYIYRNRNKATANIHTLQDKIQNEIVERTLAGDYPNRSDIKQIQRDHNFDAKVENVMDELLVNERNRIHRKESKFIDKVVDEHTQQYTKFMKNRLSIEAGRIVEKVIIIEGQALENGASPAQARQAVKEYAKTHGKARTKNIIKDAVHSQEANVSFISAVDDGFRYKVWMNGSSRSGPRAWHVARYISPVPIDEPFIINGPRGRKELYYPGDLNGGAENVANCRCWLRYTNRKPEGLRQTVFQAPPSSYLNQDTRKITVTIRDALSNVGSKVADTASNVKTKLTNVGSSIRNRFKI